jgi:LacI family transcriptional regulator
MATLERIAELSGVSRSTVSRVVNNDPNVRESTRSKVLRIMEQEHYRPNLAARGLASGRTDVIGLVIPVGLSVVFTDPFYPLLMQGIADESRNRDRFVMLWLAEPEYERQTIEQVVSRGVVDGVIIAASAPEDPLVDMLMDAGKPFVMVGRHLARTDVSFVDIGNHEAARNITRHLLRLGARRIATITGPPQMIAGSERLSGYRDALESAGIAFDPALIATTDFTAQSGAAAMSQLLEQQPDAVFAANDAMAIAAIRAIRRAGLRVPEDIAVVGFDDIPGAAEIDPPLTTVRQPIRRLGSTAATTLIELIADPGRRIREVILPTELVVRRSCGSGLNREKEN